MRSILWPWLALCLALCACTNANLSLVPNSNEFATRQTVQGKLCAPPSINQLQPYKLLFVIDTSYSTLVSDPTPVGGLSRRQQTVSDVVNKYTVQQMLANVSYGVITFSDSPRVQTATFTNSLPVVTAATDNISISQGATDYSDTLLSGTNFLESDLATLTNEQAHITHYEVLFITDGVPTVGVTDPNGVLPFVTNMMTNISPRVAELKFSTAFLGGAPDVTPQDEQEAMQLLQQMAADGNGTFSNIPQGQQFNYDVDIHPVVRKFALQSVMASNTNAQFGKEHPTVDSDGDNLTDDAEKTAKTDPTDPDTDGDGYSDGFEILYPNLLNPLKVDAGCANPNVDTDQDGLNDCEEVIAGTDVNNPDTNSNYLLDGIELFAGSSALQASSTADFDLDGFTNEDEVIQHLQVHTPNNANDMQEWGYQYQSTPAANDPNGSPCDNVTIRNISMYQTLALPGAAPADTFGHNVIALLTAFAPTDGGGPVQLYRALFDGSFILPNTETPPDGVIQLDPNAFTQLPQPAGSATSNGSAAP